MNNLSKSLVAVMLAVVFFSLPTSAQASVSVGTIDSSFKLTRICKDTSCGSFGSINWKPTINGSTPGALAVTITDTGISGHIWGDEIGWVDLAPTGSGVFVNPTTGLLSGKAFSSTGSWINFAATGQSVTLVDNGLGSNFSGYAWVSGPNGGWMKLDCSSGATCIKTDWRAIPFRPATVVAAGGGGGSASGHSAFCTLTSGQTGLQNQLIDTSGMYRSDINDSGKVDIFDFNALMVYWARGSRSYKTQFLAGFCDNVLRADVNLDGIVDILDFNLLMVHWGKRVPL